MAARNSNGSGKAATSKDKSLETWIWDAACSIRGAQDAPKYKDFILPLIFTKRLCDVFDDEVNRIAEEVGGRAKAFKLVDKDHKPRWRPAGWAEVDRDAIAAAIAP